MSPIPRRPLGRVWQAAEAAPTAAVGKTAARRFDAAVVDRLTGGWLASKHSLDQDLRTSLDRIRQRSRDLFKNNEYAIKFGRMVGNNVVGPDGFVLQSRPADPDGTVDRLAAQAIERAWWRWMRPGHCEITGRMGFVDLCRLGITSVARDGELLWRKILGARAGEFGYQLQAIDVDRLDTDYNDPALPNGNKVIMGVEVTGFGKPVAYHIWTTHPTDTHQLRERERVPADHIIHAFLPHSEGQTRGLPWMHASIRRMKDLDGYREAAVIAARAGASKMGFYTSPDGNPRPLADGGTAEGEFTREASPGSFDVLPVGYDFKAYDPTYPHDQFDAFCKEALRGISSGVGVSYPSLANDLEGVNFSSIRSGVLEERDGWMGVQNWFAATVLTPLFEEWLGAALLKQAVLLPTGRPLPPKGRAKFLEHAWQPRRWSWVDPKKDIEASILAIDNLLASPQQIAAQQGRDIEDVLDDLAAFRDLLVQRKLQRPVPSAALPPSSAPAVDDDDDEA